MAPGDLELVRQYVNTNDVEEGIDEISTPEDFRDWLSAHGLEGAGSRPTDEDVRRAIDVREALRALLLTNNGQPPDPAAVRRLNAIAEDARLLVRFEPEGGSAL